MHGPDGMNYPNESRFTRIVPSELFEIEHLSGHHFLLSIELRSFKQVLRSTGAKPSTQLSTTNKSPNS